jgi:hypothetical protein
MTNPEPPPPPTLSTALRDRISAAEIQMRADLTKARASFEQMGDRGDYAEDSVRKFLREYLPRRLELGRGEVIDAHGGRSKQTDVVIANEDHPFTFSATQPGLFFIEGVFAAAEVKSSLTTTNLEQSLENSVIFKALRGRMSNNALFYGNSADVDRFSHAPPWFIFAFEAQSDIESIGKRVIAFQTDRGLTTQQMADAVFCLDRGSLINVGDGTGSYKAAVDGQPTLGWIRSGPTSVLFDMLGWLSIVNPRVLRFEPVLARYLVEHRP